MVIKINGYKIFLGKWNWENTAVTGLVRALVLLRKWS